MTFEGEGEAVLYLIDRLAEDGKVRDYAPGVFQVLNPTKFWSPLRPRTKRR